MKTIVRVEKNKDYTVVNNTSLYDKRLSWKAKAIHVFMLSRPDNWTFHNTELLRWAKDGENAFSSGLKELKQYGYVKKERRRSQDGKFDWVTVVYEVPQENEPSSSLPCMENPSTVAPSMEKPQMENRQLLSTDVLITNKLNTDLPSDDNEKAAAITFYQENGFGVLSSYAREKIDTWIDVMGEELVIYAMKLAIDNNAIRWNYVETILKDWSQKQIKTIEQVDAEKRRFISEKSKKGQRNRGKYVEIVPSWFHQEPTEPRPSVKDEVINYDAEFQRLIKELREGGK
ncbi:DnaD domain-containing protein [Bacillus ndiopicus]|uniref:DnaD domain-containing protein n=1 Tax=Bacillus ndiopicus TaxID=1347368 RepID=UPI0005AB68B3|nr:DnaD domain protein [Bacillus ndiopicus]